MFGLETLFGSSEKQVNLSVEPEGETKELSDPLEIETKRICDEFEKFENDAATIAKDPASENIIKFNHDVKDAKKDIAEANIKKYGYNPPKEMVELHAKVEHFYNNLIRNEIACSSKYQSAMGKINELLGILAGKNELNAEDKIKVQNLIRELNSTKLELPTSHPGILANNEKSSFQIKFSETEDVEELKREANKFYSMCESDMHQLFIIIQKLFSDLLSIFDTAKASLRNDPNRKIVDNQISR